MTSMLPDSFEIINCGVGGESTLTIMARQGAAPMLLAHDVSIFQNNPAMIGNRDITAFVSSWDSTKVDVKPLLQSYWTTGGSHINPVEIEGNGFTLDSNDANYVYDKVARRYYFEYTYRLRSTNVCNELKYDTLHAGTPIVTQAMREYRNAWCNVFFMGQNGGYRDAADLIAQFQAMIHYSQCNRYIIVSHHVTNSVEPNVARMKEVEDSLSVAFGNRYMTAL